MTTEATTRMNRSALLAAKAEGRSEPLEEITVGRDVLELVSSAMYIDPMTIYREYVQNSADAIDDARSNGLISVDEAGKVLITIDPAARSIRIRDNGTGLSNAEFSRKMAALGASGKRGTKARGFRGVGRLAGLGYAQELIFRSRTAADATVAELTWDCRRLKSALRESDGDIQSLIRSVATLRKKPTEDYPDRFFEVELRGVVRLRSDKLMSPAAVDEYLGQVAPVPFAPEFRFGAEIRDALAPVVALGELDIRIEGNERPVFRPHRDILTPTGHPAIRFNRLSVSEISAIDGELAAIVWVLHHDYEGALPNAAGVKGLRLRSGNVQIGEHNLLEELFPEIRFNAWAVGEIHVVDRKIVPNGRRDHFEQNAHYHNLTNQLAPLARDIAHLCRTSSIKRNWLRETELQLRVANETLDILSQGVLGEPEYLNWWAKGNDACQRAKKALSQKVLQDEDLSGYAEKVTQVEKSLELSTRPRLAAVKGVADNERAAFLRFCEVLYQVSSSQSAAKALVDKVMAKLGDGEPIP
ncbi:molecular chaperone Hsp90 [Rhizobium leguminosarum]|uniref:ATP-binding protein n=1 Tax=Rhizobium leguminosarum TaxID=384 RepID=UPI001C92B68B|nr:ATP-binding protein [Rhizobium leguminosarum]MBY3178709.1 molecular chaperone Hsp90 [Rhizobium leguminosarum]MBY5565411.1 molecular chaperone Hsp90 [Rhizobium leguminosarum]MBY5622157.1 molecular chaperone Hsp90 [Rhizobium leguminosarum]MBY5693358.1 molecular chaperone Hsp90 [Rhizobium leguminosarum]